MLCLSTGISEQEGLKVTHNGVPSSETHLFLVHPDFQKLESSVGVPHNTTPHPDPQLCNVMTVFLMAYKEEGGL